MTTDISTTGRPARVLLATDLSARCDRALVRAAQLAGEWQGALTLLNVLDATAAPDQALAWLAGKSDEDVQHVVRRQLARDLASLGVEAAIRIVRADDVAAAVRDAAVGGDYGLVVAGVARGGMLSRCLVGSTVERLARMLSQPLLVVRNFAREPYGRIVVATDFSASSRHALLTAARLFAGRELILYHACQVPLDGASRNPGRMCRDVEEGECAAFLAASGLPPDVRIRPVIEQGPLEVVLTRYCRSHDIDLVVMGTHGRGGVMGALLGSSAATLLDWLPCDALVVRQAALVDRR